MADSGGLPRRTILSMAAAFAAWPTGAAAESGPVRRIGFLSSSTEPKYALLISAFRSGLREHGYEEGKNIAIEFGFADDVNTRLPELASRMIERRVEVIVTQGTPATRAAKKVTQRVPIVMAVAGDAVTAGLVGGLAHPNGNVTGNTFFAPELAAKRLDLLKQAAPQIKRVAVIVNPANGVTNLVMSEMAKTATALRIILVPLPVTATDELREAMARISDEKLDALVIFEDGITIGNSALIASLALQQRLPVAGFADMANSGALIGYGADIPALFRRAAYFVDRILKCSKPETLPVERAEKFQFICNLKTAKAIGLTFSSVLLAGADQIIE